jgi:hypothetical protein
LALGDHLGTTCHARAGSFFHATLAEVRALLVKIAGQHLLKYRDVPEALEWRQSTHSADASA